MRLTERLYSCNVIPLIHGSSFSRRGTWYTQKTGNFLVNDSSYLLQFKTDRWVGKSCKNYDLTDSKLHVLYLLYLLYIPLLISSVLIHRVSNTVHSCGHAWQPGQNWPHGMVSWSYSVALSEWCCYDMWLCLASFASSSLLYPFNSFYYFNTQPGSSRSSGLPSRMFNLWTRGFFALPGAETPRTIKKWTVHLSCIRHRILLQCHCMIPSRHGKLRMLISEGKGGKNTEKPLPAFEPSVMRAAKRPLQATANAACQGGSHDAQHTGHPPKCNSTSEDDEAQNVASIEHDLVKTESIGVSVWPMSLLLKQPIVRKQYSLGLRCYHLIFMILTCCDFILNHLFN